MKYLHGVKGRGQVEYSEYIDKYKFQQFQDEYLHDKWQARNSWWQIDEVFCIKAPN